MIIETIYGQIVAKANHYMSVPGKGGAKRIIKDEVIRAYERNFIKQCKTYKNKRISSRFRLFVRVWHSSPRFDLDNSLKTLLDCLQMANAITDDKLCYQIEAEKHLDKYCPRIVEIRVDEHFAKANGYKSVDDMAENTIGKAKFKELFGGVPEWIRASPNGDFTFVGINPILYN